MRNARNSTALVTRSAVTPANANRDVLPLELDPKTLVKTIAAGICLAGMQLIEMHRGRAQPPAPAPIDTDVLTADEVAALLRLDRKTVYDYAGRGVIPSKRIGKRVLFSRAAIELWLRSCSKGSSDGGSG